MGSRSATPLAQTELRQGTRRSSTAPKSTHKTRSVKGRRPVTKHSTEHSTYRSQPTPERYQQIQQALADKGYYHGEVSGKWDADSMDALKRFQTDQNLTSDGKLNSLSLIALGLGPKRTVAAAATAPKSLPEQPVSPALEPGSRQ